MPPKKLSIFGVKIDSLSLGELMEFISDCFKQQKTCFIVTVNGEILLKAEKDLNYRRVLQEADLKIVDSTNVSIVSWLKGKPIKEIIPGSSLWKLPSLPDEQIPGGQQDCADGVEDGVEGGEVGDGYHRFSFFASVVEWVNSLPTLDLDGLLPPANHGRRGAR